jgi:hypothetical protein
MYTRAVILTILILSLLLVASCAASTSGQPADGALGELAIYSQALAPSQRHLLQDLPSMPAYRIQVQVDPEAGTLTGQMSLSLPPDPEAIVPVELYFRLYPNLEHYAASMRVDLVSINGQGAPFSYAASGTALHVVVPPDSVSAGESITVDMTWHASLPTWPQGYYVLFGDVGGVLSLPLSYPVLAVRDGQAPDGWRLDLGTPQGDAAFSEMALYQVTVDAPANQVVVASGTLSEIEDVPSPDQDEVADEAPWKSWQFVAGPSREFALFLSDQFRLDETVAGDVRVNSWYLAGDEATGRAAAEYAAAALRVYGELFGAYPYAELDVVAGPLTFRGMEYPGLVELGIDLYRESAYELEFRVAHEVAHQWWYNLVGSDAVNVPWLDEGLAEYATYFYYQKVGGQEDADRLVKRWETAYAYARDRGLDAIVNQEAEAFQGNYEAMVYGKAALFHDALRQNLGDEQYLALLQRYAETSRYGVATPDDLTMLIKELGGSAAEELYQRWILEVEDALPPSPLPDSREANLDQPPEETSQ